MEKLNIRKSLKVLLICIFSFFVVRCTSTEIQYFLDGISTYDTLPENSIDPEEFLMKFKTSIQKKYENENVDKPSSFHDYNRDEENYKKNKKTGTIIVKNDKEEIYARVKFVNGKIVEKIFYYKNETISNKTEHITNGTLRMITYYPNKQLAMVTGMTKSGEYAYIKAYYEDDKSAISYDGNNRKGKMYRKDGRVKFEIINGFYYYETIS